MPRIRVDGDLHKPPWREIAPVWLQPSHGRGAARALSDADAERFLAPGAPPLPPEIRFQPTAVRVAWSPAHLHVAFHCVDRDVWGSHRGRNEPIYEEEVVELFLATGPDPGVYVELEANPCGAWFEALVTSPEGRRATMRVDRSFRCAGWERAVGVDGTLNRRDDVDRGWRVEWAIPFAALPGGRAPEPGERWRANLYRIDAADGGQWSAWSPTFTEPADFHVPDRFGWLEFA